MRSLQESSRFIWLASMLARKKARLAALLGCLSMFDGANKMKPALSAKFHHLLQQIEAERDKEFDLICDIQNLEDRHRACREQDRLEKADPDFEPSGEFKLRLGIRHFFAFLRSEGNDLIKPD